MQFRSESGARLFLGASRAIQSIASMPRPLCPIGDGPNYRVIKRGNNRQDGFHREADFEAFLRAVRRSSATGLACGDENCVKELAKELDLAPTIRPADDHASQKLTNSSGLVCAPWVFFHGC